MNMETITIQSYALEAAISALNIQIEQLWATIEAIRQCEGDSTDYEDELMGLEAAARSLKASHEHALAQSFSISAYEDLTRYGKIVLTVTITDLEMVHAASLLPNPVAADAQDMVKRMLENRGIPDGGIGGEWLRHLVDQATKVIEQTNQARQMPLQTKRKSI